MALTPDKTLIVATKVKRHLAEEHELKTSGTFIEALSQRVLELCDEAATRAKENKRKTIQPWDL